MLRRTLVIPEPLCAYYIDELSIVKPFHLIPSSVEIIYQSD
uniref:Uncharacterized protein n=1 Tax=Lepeophtheirus salmonis TaxID=72036 RepID=A0A0K2V8Q5_LEPSM